MEKKLPGPYQKYLQRLIILMKIWKATFGFTAMEVVELKLKLKWLSFDKLIGFRNIEQYSLNVIEYATFNFLGSVAMHVTHIIKSWGAFNVHEW